MGRKVQLLFHGLMVVSLLALSGCGSLSDSLLGQAEQFAKGKQEDGYYLEPPAYRMKDLVEQYTGPYRQVIWTDQGSGKQEPAGWEELGDLLLKSDDCISSTRELEQLLETAMENVVLGIELHFDKSRYLPKEGQLEQWQRSFEADHPLLTLGLEEIRCSQTESGPGQVTCLLLDYSQGLEEIRLIREQVNDAAEEILETITADAAQSGSKAESMTEREKAEAVWSYMTVMTAYPQSEDAALSESCSRADGALLDHLATGQGFAEAAKLLLDGLGLENEILVQAQETSESAKTKEPAENQFDVRDELQMLEDRYRFINRVKIDGEWWQMDCCFGAVTEGNRDFFKKEAVDEDAN